LIVQHVVARRVAAFAASIALHLAHYRLLGQEIHTAGIAADTMLQGASSEQQILTSTTTSWKSSIACLDKYHESCSPSFQKHLPSFPVAPLWRTLAETLVPESLSHIEHDCSPPFLQAATSQQILADIQVALAELSARFSAFGVVPPPAAEHFDALYLYEQMHVLPLQDWHRLHAPFKRRPLILEGDYITICNLKNQEHLDGTAGQALHYDDSKLLWIVLLASQTVV
jgi:hypothetical protein